MKDGNTGRPDPRSATAMDQTIGRRIRAAREAAGLGQVALAEAIGVTFQQIQKYENGRNRVSATRLFEICKVLGVPIASMFEE
jgi:transcriptional regulator with XRE-family HTH domain